MPTFYQQPIDVQWIVALDSSTQYVGWFPALAAAVALSAANSNAPVQIAQIEMQCNANAPGPNQAVVRMFSSGAANATPAYFVQLQSGTTYYPQATALVQGYALSAANANAFVDIARVIEVVTAP